MMAISKWALLTMLASVSLAGCGKPDNSSQLLADCVNDGIAYFKATGSYPTLKTDQDRGEAAESVANKRCADSYYAFQGLPTQPEKPPEKKKKEGKHLAVPSDPNADFYVLDKAKRGSMSVIITKRVGSSGTSYSSRLYNCQDNTVKYLGTGETRQAMEQSNPDPNMSPIAEGSIAYYVGVEACK